MKRYFVSMIFAAPLGFDLISAAIICEDGREYFVINQDFDLFKASNFIKSVILPAISTSCLGKEPIRKSRQTLIQEMAEFVFGKENEYLLDEPPEFWSAWCNNDTPVVSFIDPSTNSPYPWNDVIQLMAKSKLTYRDLPLRPDDSQRYNTLAVARWIKSAWETIQKL